MDIILAEGITIRETALSPTAREFGTPLGAHSPHDQRSDRSGACWDISLHRFRPWRDG